MQITNALNNTIRILFNPRIEAFRLFDFLIVKSGEDRYLAQIIETYDDKFDASQNVAKIKLFYKIARDNEVLPYDNFTPNKECEIVKIDRQIVESFLNQDKETFVFGKNAKDGSELSIQYEFFENNPIILADKIENSCIMTNSLAKNLSKKRPCLVIDSTGIMDFDDANILKAAQNFKLPLTPATIDFVFDKCLEDASFEFQTISAEIITEIKEYAKSLPDGFIPFNSFVKVILDQYRATPYPELKLFIVRLKRYQLDKIFAHNKAQAQTLNNAIEEGKTVVADLSSLDVSWQKVFLEFIVENVEKDVYLLARLNDENCDSDLINRIYNQKKNIRFVPNLSYNYKKLPSVIQNCKNYVLLASLYQRTDFLDANFALSNLISNGCILFGENTDNFLYLASDYNIAPEKKKKNYRKIALSMVEREENPETFLGLGVESQDNSESIIKADLNLQNSAQTEDSKKLLEELNRFERENEENKVKQEITEPSKEEAKSEIVISTERDLVFEKKENDEKNPVDDEKTVLDALRTQKEQEKLKEEEKQQEGSKQKDELENTQDQEKSEISITDIKINTEISLEGIKIDGEETILPQAKITLQNEPFEQDTVLPEDEKKETTEEILKEDSKEIPIEPTKVDLKETKKETPKEALLGDNAVEDKVSTDTLETVSKEAAKEVNKEASKEADKKVDKEVNKEADKEIAKKETPKEETAKEEIAVEVNNETENKVIEVSKQEVEPQETETKTETKIEAEVETETEVEKIEKTQENIEQKAVDKIQAEENVKKEISKEETAKEEIIKEEVKEEIKEEIKEENTKETTINETIIEEKQPSQPQETKEEEIELSDEELDFFEVAQNTQKKIAQALAKSEDTKEDKSEAKEVIEATEATEALQTSQKVEATETIAKEIGAETDLELNLAEIASNSINDSFEKIINDETLDDDIKEAQSDTSFNNDFQSGINSKEKKESLPVFKEEVKNKSFSGTYSVGLKVSHKVYGVGVVTKLISYEDRQLLQIEFENIGKKLLDPNVADIKVEGVQGPQEVQEAE